MIWWTTPFLLIAMIGFAGIVVWHVIPSRLPNIRLAVQLVFFCAMSALLIEENLVPYEAVESGRTNAETVLAGAAKLLWWLHLAWALIAFVRIFLFIERKPREARLLQDVLVGVIYAGMGLSILAFVFAVPVGTLIATSGVFAIVLGLALQNTLSDVFSGIALDLGRPYALGDWIALGDGTEGRVVATNWRSTHLLTLAHNVVALPNSVLARLSLTNVSSPDETHGVTVTIRLAPVGAPATVVEVLHTALLGCNTIVKEPRPAVIVTGLDAAAIEIHLAFRVKSVSQRVAARNEVFDLVYRHARANGLALAAPPSALMEVAGRGISSARPMPIDLIRASKAFSTLTDEEQRALADAAKPRLCRSGEIVARQGDVLSALTVVRTGVIARQRGDGEVPAEVAGYLSPGDFFGEGGVLTGAGEPFTLRAASHAELYEIARHHLAALLHEHPEMTDELASASAVAETPVHGAEARRHARSRDELIRSIRSAFQAFRPDHPRHIDDHRQGDNP